MPTKKTSSSRGRSTSRSRSTSSRGTSTRSTSSSRSHGRSEQRKQAGSGDYTHVTTNHDEIRRWAEERGAHPACVRGTGSSEDVGLIRLDFPDYSGAQSLQPVDWDEWFQKFDERDLALVYRERTAKGEKSNFNKLVSREDAQERYGKGSSRSRSKSRSSHGR